MQIDINLRLISNKIDKSEKEINIDPRIRDGLKTGRVMFESGVIYTNSKVNIIKLRLEKGFKL